MKASIKIRKRPSAVLGYSVDGEEEEEISNHKGLAYRLKCLNASHTQKEVIKRFRGVL